MPAMVGAVNLNVMSGVFNIGDAQTIAPTQLIKIFAGSGSFNTADKMEVKTSPSVIHIYDSSAYEENIVGGL